MNTALLTPNVIADATVAVLLVATIFYAALLSRRLRALRGDKAELQALIQNLAAASQSAEAGIAALRSAAEDSGRKLAQQLEQSQSLRDDLSFMIERGTSVADRLQEKFRARRDSSAPEATANAAQPAEAARAEARSRREPALGRPAAPPVAPPPETAPAAASRAERNLLRALAGRR
jgi:hypothetical protein